MPNTEIRKFDGLYLQSNSFDVPDGAMEIAENVVIQNDNIISKTKGYYEWWRPGGGDVLQNVQGVFTYQRKLIGIFDNGIGHFDDSSPYADGYNARGVLTKNLGTASGFGDYAYFAQANSNLYITGDFNISRLEAYDSTVRKAGVPPALSVEISVKYTDIGVLPPDSQTAYRVVFGRRDFNGNLILSSPSDVVTKGIPAPKTLMAYTVTAGVATIQDPDLIFWTGEQIRYITVTSATNTLLNGAYTTIDSGSPDEIAFNTAQPNGTGTLTLSVIGTATIVAQIPSEINDTVEEWFAQVYRTTSSIGVAVAPEPNFSLVTEQVLTTGDLTGGQFTYTDIVDPELFGAQLYTNPNSREGEDQENSRPPKANVMVAFKGYMLYMNVRTVQRMTLDLVNALDELDTINIVFRSDGVTETYSSPLSVTAYPSPVTATGTGVIVITDNNNVPTTGDTILVTDITGTLLPGKYTIISTSFPTYSISAAGKTMTAGTVAFLSHLGKFVYDCRDSSGGTPAQLAEVAARNLVQSINRNSSYMYANYRSTFTDFPGRFSIQSKTVREPIYVITSAPTSAPVFIQPVPSDFSDVINPIKQVYSENDILENGIFVSKIGEPEAVPALNSTFAGDSSASILDAVALRDCVIIIKEDGAFKLSGDTINDFQVTPLDTTVKFPRGAIRAAGSINNVCIGLSNQGIVQVTDNSVQIISRRIDNGIQPLAGQILGSTYLGGNEADRLFYINTSGINDGDPDVCWVYNVLNQTWSTTTSVFKSLSTGPDDATFGLVFDSDVGGVVIHRQRKTQTLVDYCGKYCVGNITVDPSKLMASFIITGGNTVTPAVGDVILYNNVFSRIVSSISGGGGFTLKFFGQTNIPVSTVTEVAVYKAYRSTVKMAPFHAGQVTLSKHFSEMQIHLRQAAISDLKITFAGAYFGSSELTNWTTATISSQGSTGWGFSPWGFFPWGLADGIKLTTGTQAATIIRTWVPRFAARNTWIAVNIVHQIAGQPMVIQAIGYTVRGYGPRTTK